MSSPDRRARILGFDAMPGVACPCGTSRLALLDVPEFPGTIHRTEITDDANPFG